MKKLIALMMTTALTATLSIASTAITWSTGGQLLNNAANTTLLAGSNLNPGGELTSGFIQLLYLGAGGTYGGYTASGTGVVEDDAVVATGWIGIGIGMAANDDGAFTVPASPHSYPDGSAFIIRFFDTPSPNYAGGAVPTTGNYGLSSTFVSTASPADTFQINSSDYTDIPIPEPGTMALGLIGLVTVAFRKLRK